jgi:signal peptidase II
VVGDPGTPTRTYDDPRADPAGRSRRAWTVLIVAIVLFVAADLLSKWAAFHWIAGQPVPIDKARVVEIMRQDPHMLQVLVPEHRAITVLPHVLELKLVLNAGAVFGAGSGRRWFFVGFTLVALGFAVYMFAAWATRRDWMTHVALALIIAGGLGNLYDRIVFACVRDFLHPLPGVLLPFGWSWPTGGGREVWPYVSNVADAFLLIGIGVALVRLVAQDRREAKAAKAEAAASD